MPNMVWVTFSREHAINGVRYTPGDHQVPEGLRDALTRAGVLEPDWDGVVKKDEAPLFDVAFTDGSDE